MKNKEIIKELKNLIKEIEKEKKNREQDLHISIIGNEFEAIGYEENKKK